MLPNTNAETWTGWRGNLLPSRKRSAPDKSAEGPQVKAAQTEYCIAMLRPTCGAGNSEALSSGAARP